MRQTKMAFENNAHKGEVSWTLDGLINKYNNEYLPGISQNEEPLSFQEWLKTQGWFWKYTSNISSSQLQAEYEKAKTQGFVGNIEKYLMYRDYT